MKMTPNICPGQTEVTSRRNKDLAVEPLLTRDLEIKEPHPSEKGSDDQVDSALECAGLFPQPHTGKPICQRTAQSAHISSLAYTIPYFSWLALISGTHYGANWPISNKNLQICTETFDAQTAFRVSVRTCRFDLQL